MQVVHGQAVDERVDVLHLAHEVTATWQGLEIALPEQGKRAATAASRRPRWLTRLVDLTRHTKLARYRKHPRGPKKKPPPRTGNSPHVSTQRILNQRQPR